MQAVRKEDPLCALVGKEEAYNLSFPQLTPN